MANPSASNPRFTVAAILLSSSTTSSFMSTLDDKSRRIDRSGRQPHRQYRSSAGMATIHVVTTPPF
jgi:hypothetical protein